MDSADLYIALNEKNATIKQMQSTIDSLRKQLAAESESVWRRVARARSAYWWFRLKYGAIPPREYEEAFDIKSMADYEKQLDTLKDRIEELEEEWVSVLDRLPEGSQFGKWYIVKYADGTTFFADWDNDLKRFLNPRCEYDSPLDGVVSWKEMKYSTKTIDK